MFQDEVVGTRTPLDTRFFAGIHRSTIVNLDRVTEVAPQVSGDFDVVLNDARVLRMSRGYRDRLLLTPVFRRTAIPRGGPQPGAPDGRRTLFVLGFRVRRNCYILTTR